MILDSINPLLHNVVKWSDTILSVSDYFTTLQSKRLSHGDAIVFSYFPPMK